MGGWRPIARPASHEAAGGLFCRCITDAFLMRFGSSNSGFASLFFFFFRKASTAWTVCRTEGAGQVHLPPPGRTVPPPSCPVTRRGRPQGPTVESSVRAHPIGLMGAGFTLGGSPAMSGGHFWSLLLAEVGRWRPAGSGRALSTPHSQDSPARWASGPEASTPAPSSSLPQILQF